VARAAAAALVDAREEVPVRSGRSAGAGEQRGAALRAAGHAGSD
jgi:hypothetical protein